MTSIYISVPNCLDSEYYKTLSDIFSNSDNPNNIYVGTAHSIPFKNQASIDEIKSNTSEYSNIRFKFLNHYRNSGVGYGRLESMSMYDGEDYILQIDSHTMLQPSWDSKLIQYFNEAKDYSGNNKTILSAYLSSYKYYDQNKRDLCAGTMPLYPCYVDETNILNYDKDFDSGKKWKEIYSPIPRWITVTDDEFLKFIENKFAPVRKLNANFIFSDSNLARDYSEIIPYPFFFFEEEFIMSVQAYNLGYSLIYPNFKLPLAHIYANDFNEFYSRKNIFMDQGYARIEKARNKILDYLNNNQDRVKKYAEYAGLTYPELESISVTYIPER